MRVPGQCLWAQGENAIVSPAVCVGVCPGASGGMGGSVCTWGRCQESMEGSVQGRQGTMPNWQHPLAKVS